MQTALYVKREEARNGEIEANQNDASEFIGFLRSRCNAYNRHYRLRLFWFFSLRFFYFAFASSCDAVCMCMLYMYGKHVRVALFEYVACQKFCKYYLFTQK